MSDKEVIRTTPLRVPTPVPPKFNSEGKLEAPCRICAKMIVFAPEEDTSLGVLCKACGQTTLTAAPASGIQVVICKCNTTLHFSDADVAGVCPNKNCKTKMIVNPPLGDGYYVMCPECSGVLTCPKKASDSLAMCPNCKKTFFPSATDRANFVRSRLRNVLIFLTICVLLVAILPLDEWYLIALEFFFAFPIFLNLKVYFSNRRVIPMKQIQITRIPCSMDL
eukprot:Phypoly_transcript_13003.p1 GENE.Phypoly_transcript_13003~~Phypoly_transcript_13003.p1  ORF type:complete len:222 (+),score=11.07 Phypoly_transcript_13003:265-930(+)